MHVSDFSNTLTRESLKRDFPKLIGLDQLNHSYHFRSKQSANVIVKEQEEWHLKQMTWGLILEGSKGINDGRLHNARIESIESQNSFRMAYRFRRCVIPMDSFYIWQERKMEKVPYRIYAHDFVPLYAAGVWEEWKSSAYSVFSFAMLIRQTLHPLNTVCSYIPVFIDGKDAIDEWICSTDHFQLTQRINMLPMQELKYYRITDSIIDPDYNDPKLHIPVPDVKDLFS